MPERGTNSRLCHAEAAFVSKMDSFLFGVLSSEMNKPSVESLLGPAVFQLGDFAFYRNGIQWLQEDSTKYFPGIIGKYDSAGNLVAKAYNGKIVIFPTVYTNKTNTLHHERLDLRLKIDAMLFDVLRPGMGRVAVESLLGPPILNGHTNAYYRYNPFNDKYKTFYSVGSISVFYSCDGLLTRKVALFSK